MFRKSIQSFFKNHCVNNNYRSSKNETNNKKFVALLYVIFLIIIASVALLTTSACAPSADKILNRKMFLNSNEHSYTIVNGSSVDATDEISKSLVGILTKSSNGTSLCTGSIIENDIILTAAHCLKLNSNDVTLLFGHNLSQIPDDHRRKAISFSQHPRWFKDPGIEGQGDLALIYFEGGLPEGFKPLPLVNRKFNSELGTKILEYGFGVNEGEKRIGEGILRETSSKIISQHSKSEYLTDGRTSGICFGDSGGPAIVHVENKSTNAKHFALWGVASTVTSESCDQGSIHTSIAAYKGWLRDTIELLRGKTGEE